ncbi:hypothetical protein [Kitasatospora sp. NPDC059673]|uniref:hypothetical protein n=1 Tax=Kitasatospora sp. NPDC059673 TaxID=3346901 RepID=UPI003680573F
MTQTVLDDEAHTAVELAERVLEGELLAEPGTRPCAEQQLIAVMGDGQYNFC